jgi:hypothetical protein
MRRTSAIRSLSAVAALTMGVLTAGSASADVRAAATWPNDTYYECSDNCDGFARGGVVWGNRTAQIQGSVQSYRDTTTVYFDAFAGSTKVDSETRSSSGPEVSYNFTIGDPDLPGGVDRIRVQVCTPLGADRGCGVQFNMIRD